MHLQESGEMYLESIYVLLRRNPHVRAIDVGEYMGYSKPSVSRAMSLLKNGGIKVPESSKFVCDGTGLLKIHIDGSGFYAVGNDIDAKHGELVFENGIMVENYAATGVCIGSGLGGRIRIIRGQFILNMRGYCAAQRPCPHRLVGSLLDEKSDRFFVEFEGHILLRQTAAQECQFKVEDYLHVLCVKLAEYNRLVEAV